MLSSDQIKRHAILMDNMAQARGLDMEEQVLRGAITSSEVGDAVLSCTNCTNPAGCAHWLEANRGVAEQTPSYCRNSALFEDLIRG